MLLYYNSLLLFSLIVLPACTPHRSRSPAPRTLRVQTVKRTLYSAQYLYSHQYITDKSPSFLPDTSVKSTIRTENPQPVAKPENNTQCLIGVDTASLGPIVSRTEMTIATSLGAKAQLLLN